MKSNFSSPGFLWPLLTLVCLLIILYGLNQILKRTTWTIIKKRKLIFGAVLLIAGWSALLTVLSYKGFFANFSALPPRPALAVLTPLPFILWFTFSKTGTELLQRVPSQWLIFMQSFRIFVEVLLWFAFLAGKLPVQMSFEGRNFDILTGLLALPAGFLLLKKKAYAPRIIIAFNVVGIVLLLNILIIAILSMPTSIRYFMNEPSNTLVAQFPYILLPGVLVPIAYSFHIFSLRQLSIKNKLSFINNYSQSIALTGN
ncbi:MAG TPA: hypothetical protein VK369_01420 [Segetibacter sp.]|nr:hypothetical protein [Segetibacter sp.]